jgi:Response regulator containing CheY-like receiver, AAA-type ATPase, and DNA-binding domains
MPEPLNILVVEDDLQLRDALCLTLECAGHHVMGAADGPAALHLLEREAFNLVVSDLRMQPMDGIELLKAIRGSEPHLPVLLMTAFGDVDKAVSAMRAGACDFLLKPFEPKVLLEHVARHAAQPSQAEGVIAADPRTRNLLALAARVAKTEATVMLTGESGTGKEVFARHIHSQSPRHGAPFVAINCAAIPENLLEATLFGHEKGSFTGAQAAQAGKFEQAQGGTLLLDEISEMPLALQAKLLRVLQEREVERVGGKKPIPLDIRVLATSNRDMAKEVAAGRFREDLYYRLNVFPCRFPRCASGRRTSCRWAPLRRPARQPGGKVCRRCRGAIGRPCLAGQCARVGERGAAGADPGRRRHHRGRAPAAFPAVLGARRDAATACGERGNPPGCATSGGAVQYARPGTPAHPGNPGRRERLAQAGGGTARHFRTDPALQAAAVPHGGSHLRDGMQVAVFGVGRASARQRRR